MIKSQYKREMDKIVPRCGFEEETIAFLEQVVNPQSKEEKTMLSKRSVILIAAIAAVFLMASTVFAAAVFLRPDEVADAVGETEIAEAFRSEDAVLINQSIQSNGYEFTLIGIVSGKGLEGLDIDTEAARSYVVLAIEHTDGTPFECIDDFPFTVTPIIDGYEPWRMSIYTLNACRMDTTKDGVRYCLISTNSLELFADHRVRLAVFDGIAPGTDVFAMGEDGVISYADSYTGTKAMFDLPLDPAKADPAAAQALIAQWEAECAGDDTAASSVDAIIDDAFCEVFACEKDGERYCLSYEADGTLHVYDSDGNELPAEDFEGITKWGTVSEVTAP